MFQYRRDSLGVDSMSFSQDSFGEAFNRIVWLNFNSLLLDYSTTIQRFVNKMN